MYDLPTLLGLRNPVLNRILVKRCIYPVAFVTNPAVESGIYIKFGHTIGKTMIQYRLFP